MPSHVRAVRRADDGCCGRAAEHPCQDSDAACVHDPPCRANPRADCAARFGVSEGDARGNAVAEADNPGSEVDADAEDHQGPGGDPVAEADRDTPRDPGCVAYRDTSRDAGSVRDGDPAPHAPPDPAPDAPADPAPHAAPDACSHAAPDAGRDLRAQPDDRA